MMPRGRVFTRWRQKSCEILVRELLNLRSPCDTVSACFQGRRGGLVSGSKGGWRGEEGQLVGLDTSKKWHWRGLM